MSEIQNVRRRFTRAFKLDGVRRVAEDGQSQAQVARDLGIRADTLRRWQRQVEQKGAMAFPGHDWARSGDSQTRQLMQENRRLREERDVLKRALVICGAATALTAMAIIALPARHTAHQRQGVAEI